MRHWLKRKPIEVSFWAFGIATVLFTAFGLAGFARFGDDVRNSASKCQQALEVLGNVLKSGLAGLKRVPHLHL